MQLVMLKVRLIILLCDRLTKQMFIMSGSFQMYTKAKIVSNVNANLQLVDKFCYLGDMLSADGDADAAVETEFKLNGINSGS